MEIQTYLEKLAEFFIIFIFLSVVTFNREKNYVWSFK